MSIWEGLRKGMPDLWGGGLVGLGWVGLHSVINFNVREEEGILGRFDT